MNEVAQQRPRRRTPRRDRSSSVSRDEGFSVVEVVFTITLIALVIVHLVVHPRVVDSRCDRGGRQRVARRG